MSPARARKSLTDLLPAASESPAAAPDQPAPELDRDDSAPLLTVTEAELDASVTGAPHLSAPTGETDGTSDREPPPEATSTTPVTAEPRRTGPTYSTYYRKEARLRPDQSTQLTDLARALQGARARMPGERITDNTLIRVAVDLLLQRRDRLTGTSEAELFTSVADPP